MGAANLEAVERAIEETMGQQPKKQQLEATSAQKDLQIADMANLIMTMQRQQQEMEAQRQEIDAHRREMDAQRREMDTQRREMEAKCAALC